MKTQQIITPEMARAARGDRTREDVAALLGVHWRTIQNWEIGQAKMHPLMYQEYLRVTKEAA